MIQVSKEQIQKLRQLNLLKDGLNGDRNYCILNDKNSKSKTYYVYADFAIMTVLGLFENLPLQKITYKQFEELRKVKLLDNKVIQFWGLYVPNALAFEDEEGQWRIMKKTALMKHLKIWK